MTVTGTTTAVLATNSYVPPFKSVFSPAPAVSVTGTVTKPVSNNPTVTPGTTDSDYAWAYLQSHMMSWPSYRYIYLMWFVFILIGILYSLSHHLRFNAGSIGSSNMKWAIRRRAIGKRRAGGARPRALPSNGSLFTIAVLGVVVLVLSLIGADYISPYSSVLNFGTSFKKRYIYAPVVHLLNKRQFPIPGQIQYNSPGYTINKSLWTLASRFGDTAFAIIPLTVILGLKSPPIAILAWRGFAHLYSDKLASFHKATAWMIWLATTAHVAMWTVQLFLDRKGGGLGTFTWVAMWTNYRFIAGAAGYFTLTALMITSLRIVRKKQYEFFYVAHVTLIILTLGLCAVHHPVLWFWMAAAFAIWVLERTWRAIRFWRINKTSGSSRIVKSSHNSSFSQKYQDVPQHDAYGMQDIKSPYSHEYGRPSSYIDKTLPKPPGIGRDGNETPSDWSPNITPETSTIDLPHLPSRLRGGAPSPVRNAQQVEYNRRPRQSHLSQQSQQSAGYYDEDAFRPLSYASVDPYSQPRHSGAYEEPGYGIPDPYANTSSHSHTYSNSGSRFSRAESEEFPARVSSSLNHGPTEYQNNLQSRFSYPSQPTRQSEETYTERTPKENTRKSDVSNRRADTTAETLTPSYNTTLIPVSQPPIAIPTGHALAQLLPSRTVRLTIKIAHPFKWSPGQSVLLYLPELSKLQSHPFTISNLPNSAGEIIIIVKARKGLTRKLFETVRSKSISASAHTGQRTSVLSGKSISGKSLKNVELQDSKPIYMRTRVDGPFGSAARVHWGDYSTVIIICGGSGVSFGVAILEAVTRGIRERAGAKLKTKRLRFCWIAREYAEIAWVAHQLRSSQEMLNAAQLEIEIFITNSSTASSHQFMSSNPYDPYNSRDKDEFAPPRAAFAKSNPHKRSSSMDSLDSVASDVSLDSPGQGFSGSNAISVDGETVDPHGQEDSYADVIDLTNYDDEEDVNDPVENELSAKLREQGKVRRAKSRRVTRRKNGRSGGFEKAGDYVEPNPPASGSAFDRVKQSGMVKSQSQPSGLRSENQGYDDEAIYSSSGQNRPYSYNQWVRRSEDHDDPDITPRPPNSESRMNKNVYPPPAFPSNFSNGERRGSYRSISDSLYGRYDPFASPGTPVGLQRGQSPNPSMFFNAGDDRQSIAGESTRGILPHSQSNYSFARSGLGDNYDNRASRTGSMVLLDSFNPDDREYSDDTGPGRTNRKAGGLWVDMADYESMVYMSEFAKSGKPNLGKIIEEEVERAEGSLIVTTCGPTTLNTVVRNLVSKNISPSRIRRGDKRGHIAIYSEDYDG